MRCGSGQPMRDRFRLKQFWRNQQGASAVEFALIAPLLFSLLLGIIQYGSLFLIQGRMTDTARDTARRLAVGDLANESDAEAYAAAALADMSPRFKVTAALPHLPDRDVSVVITVPKEDVAWVDLVGFGMTGDLTAQFHMLKE
jgi:Flp pilus assembly protein TadG